MVTKPTVEDMWRAMLTGQDPGLRRGRHLFGLLPSNPRCKFCNIPFRGPGALLMRLFGKRRSDMNPYFCDACESFARDHLGGAEVEMTLFFADVRDSSALAERLGAVEFSLLMGRFYAAASRVLIKTDAFVNKLVGDEVVGHYIPGFAGPEHAHKATQAAQDLLHLTGHGAASDPWIPVGVGIHTGNVFFGSFGGTEGTFVEMTALGDNVNIAARLASAAGPGEILVTEATCTAAGLNPALERRQLDLKGRSEPVSVRVLRVVDR